MSTPAVTREWADRISDLYRRIASVTTAYTFTWPVEPADVATVHDALAAAVPECAVCTMIDAGYIHVDVSLDERTIYHRAMMIITEVS